MAEAHINIGSNLGNSRSLIERAVAGISVLPNVSVRARSAFIESDAWGFESANRFVNQGVEIVTSLPAAELMSQLLSVQNGICADSHRTDAGGYADRQIDIDLIHYGDLVVSSAELTLPHPRMHLREFVLVPLMELSPGWVHPLTGCTAAEMLGHLRCMNGNTTERTG